jgi:hypothetical protein
VLTHTLGESASAPALPPKQVPLLLPSLLVQHVPKCGRKDQLLRWAVALTQAMS